MKKLLLALVMGLLCAVVYAHHEPPEGIKSVDALRIKSKIQLDGVLNESEWATAPLANGFVQAEPVPGATPSHETEVRILYDDNGIYFGARLYDTRPDSILRELSQRDRIANTDWFAVFIDAYRDGNNGLMFLITPGGVQMDAKISPIQNSDGGWNIVRGEDANWDAVWESQTSITEDGWIAEIRIPYAALRFPKASEQEWRINFGRLIQRYQQRSYWSNVNPQQAGFLNQGGMLTGIRDIRSPLRLQATPFVAVYGQHFRDKNASPQNSTSRSINGGMDIKYGINDAFTLDMTLIPDFGEAQSDNQVLNLSPFEVRFDENRQFFTEGTELFNKGGLFYSRRVGGTPLHYWDVYDHLQDGEEVIENPQQAQLYNATKISGRTKSGLGVGFFNATSGRSVARIRNAEGDVREMETNPLTNFNVLVLDQNLPHNSYATLINTTVIRNGSDYDANVSGAVFLLRNKSNTYSLEGKGVLSQLYHPGQTELGHTAGFGLRKTSGNLFFGIHYNEESDTYNPNDLGFLFNNNERAAEGWVEYNQFKPFWKFNSAGIGFWNMYSRLYAPNTFTLYGANAWGWVQTKSFWNFNFFTYHEPFTGYDYFEPRTEGRYFKTPANNNYGFNINTDSRKKIQLSVNTNYRTWSGFDRHRWNWTLSPRYRVNDKLNFRLSVGAYNFVNDLGFADKQTVDILNPETGELTPTEQVIFGRRDNITVENILNASYTFSKNIALTFRMRHYWSKVEYNKYYLLLDDGGLGDTNYAGNRNGNYNAFNIDMIFRWRFAPGSDIFLIWKNNITDFNEAVVEDYFRNLDGLAGLPQRNSLSLKVIYFLDYASLVKS